MLSAQGDKLIRAAEGCRSTAYCDTLGNWTAGIGHKLPAAQNWTNVAFTSTQIQAWYASDVADATRLALSLPEYTTIYASQCREDALIELCFNLEHRWLKFINARGAMMKQNWVEASAQILNSAAYAQEPARIARLAAMILTGEYPA